MCKCKCNCIQLHLHTLMISLRVFTLGGINRTYEFSDDSLVEDVIDWIKSDHVGAQEWSHCPSDRTILRYADGIIQHDRKLNDYFKPETSHDVYLFCSQTPMVQAVIPVENSENSGNSGSSGSSETHKIKRREWGRPRSSFPGYERKTRFDDLKTNLEKLSSGINFFRADEYPIFDHVVDYAIANNQGRGNLGHAPLFVTNYGSVIVTALYQQVVKGTNQTEGRTLYVILIGHKKLSKRDIIRVTSQLAIISPQLMSLIKELTVFAQSDQARIEDMIMGQRQHIEPIFDHTQDMSIRYPHGGEYRNFGTIQVYQPSYDQMMDNIELWDDNNHPQKPGRGKVTPFGWQRPYNREVSYGDFEQFTSQPYIGDHYKGNLLRPIDLYCMINLASLTDEEIDNIWQ
jgi:hypothetical protein